jgi:hypothetical protein
VRQGRAAEIQIIRPRTDGLVAPAPHGGGEDVVAACHVGQALVVPQHREDDERDLPGPQRPPACAYRLQVAAQPGGELPVGELP